MVKARGPKDSRAYGGEKPYMRHLVQDPGMGRFLRDLSEDVDRAFRYREQRYEHPNITFVDLSEGSPNTSGGLLVVKGENFLQGQLFEAYTHGTGNAALTFTALKPGRFQHKVVISDTGSLSVAYSAGTKTVTIGVNAGVTDANAVATAVNAAGAATKGIIRCAAGGTGAGFPAALTETNFTTGYPSDGYGDGFSAMVSGVEALPYHETGTTPTAAIEDTQVRLTLPNLAAESTPREADDPMELYVKSDGTQSQNFAFTINTLRKTSTPPLLNWIDSSVGTAMATGGYMVVRGENMLQSQTFDSYTHGTGASELVFTAMKPGISGYSVELLDTGAESVALAAGKLTVNFDGPANTNTSTANSVATAVNATGSAAKGYIRCVSGGAGAVAALAEDDFAGGTGSGFSAKVSGVEALPYHAAGTAPAATIADAVITLQLPDLTAEATPRSSDDQIELSVVSDGLHIGTLSYRSNSVRMGYPRINGVDASASTFAASGGDITLDGENLLQNQTFDTLVHGAGAAALTFSDLTPGNNGKSVEVIDAGALSVVYGGDKLTLNIDAGVTTANAAATAVNAADSAAKGYIRCVSGGGGTPAALVETPLAGGTGSGLITYVGGVACLPAHATGAAPAASISDTSVAVTLPRPSGMATPRAAADALSVMVDTDGVRTAEFNVLERHARPDAPEIHNWDGPAVNNANNTITLNGVHLLQGQTFDTHRLVPAAGGYMDTTALWPGAGSGITLELVSGGGADVVTVVGTAISVDYNAGVSTTDSIATAINTDAAAGILVRCWSDAANAMAGGDAIAPTALTNGVGGGMTLQTGGTAATAQVGVGAQQAARVTDTALEVDTGDMNGDWGAAAGDHAAVIFISDGVYARVYPTAKLT